MRRLFVLSICFCLFASGCGQTKEKIISPQHGGTLRVGSVDKIARYPWEAATADQLALMRMVYGTLVTVDAKGAIHPGIAKSWSVSADQKSWDFVLAPDAKFSNGNPIHAADIKTTIEKISKKDSVSSAASVLELVHGFIQYHDEGNSDNIEGIKAVSETDIRFTLDSPWADLPTALASPSFGVAPQNVSDKSLVSSGIFKVSNEKDDSTTLVPRSNSSTYVDKIEWKHYSSDTALATAAASDDIDVALGSTKGDKQVHFKYGGTLFYSMNIRGSLSDARVRSAILHAINRSEIEDHVYGRTNLTSNGVVPNGMLGWGANACGDVCKYELKTAKSDVAQVGAANIPTIHIDTDSSATQKAIAIQMKEQLALAGIKAVLRPHKTKDYATFLQSGQQEVFQAGRVPEFLSADAVVWPLFSSGSADNVIGIHDDGLDQALDAARRESDPAKRAQMLVDSEHSALQNSIVIPLAQVLRPVGVSKRVHNVSLDLLGTFDASKIWLG
jgi:ABC-type transport system substrate-binding protein